MLPTTISHAPPSYSRATSTHCCPLSDKLILLIDQTKSINHLRQIHGAVYRHNLHHHHILNFKLQRSYSSLNRLDLSLTLFNGTTNPNVYLYSSIIHAHAVQNLHRQALLLFIQMLNLNVEPNVFTFSSILKSCPLETGKLIHSHVIKSGFDSDLYVKTCLVDVYAKWGNVESARILFDEMSEKGLVSITAMMTSYAKYGQLNDARELFDEMLERDVVSWNVMIDGYTQHGLPNKALGLFRKMLVAKNVKPNEVTVLAVLSSCGQIGALESGRWVHSYIDNNKIQVNVHVGAALINMYSKCGSVEDARLVFDNMKKKDVVVWNSMIVGYAMHGFSQHVFQLFSEMYRIGHKPTDITFIGVLTACSHGGLVQEGRRFFKSMKTKFNIDPKLEHYGCMVNILGRAGCIKEAYELVMSMKHINPDPVLWGSLLSACRLNGNIDLAEEIAENLVNQNLAHSGTYTLLSNMHAGVGNFDGVARVRKLMKERGVAKEPGCSSIEVNNKVHEFLAGDMRNKKSKEIYAMLEEMNRWLKANGYNPQTDVVLHDLEEAEKEQSLQVHSEKLAIAFGLISTKPGTTLKIMKNLRVCADCHAVAKLISSITSRKIVMRDRNRFHHFENGSCSCQDFW